MVFSPSNISSFSTSNIKSFKDVKNLVYNHYNTYSSGQQPLKEITDGKPSTSVEEGKPIAPPRKTVGGQSQSKKPNGTSTAQGKTVVRPKQVDKSRIAHKKSKHVTTSRSKIVQAEKKNNDSSPSNIKSFQDMKNYMASSYASSQVSFRKLSDAISAKMDIVESPKNNAQMKPMRIYEDPVDEPVEINRKQKDQNNRTGDSIAKQQDVDQDHTESNDEATPKNDTLERSDAKTSETKQQQQSTTTTRRKSITRTEPESESEIRSLAMDLLKESDRVHKQSVIMKKKVARTLSRSLESSAGRTEMAT